MPPDVAPTALVVPDRFGSTYEQLFICAGVDSAMIPTPEQVFICRDIASATDRSAARFPGSAPLLRSGNARAAPPGLARARPSRSPWSHARADGAGARPMAECAKGEGGEAAAHDRARPVADRGQDRARAARAMADRGAAEGRWRGRAADRSPSQGVAARARHCGIGLIALANLFLPVAVHPQGCNRRGLRTSHHANLSA